MTDAHEHLALGMLSHEPLGSTDAVAPFRR
jgi:hypothetical protein